MIDPRDLRAALRAGGGEVAFFDSLDADGQFVEYARARAMLLAGGAWAPRGFAGWLGLPSTRRYRAVLFRPEPLRAALVDVARDLLCRERERLGDARRSAAFARWNAELTRNPLELVRRTGRPVARVVCAGDAAREIEDRRVHLGWTVKRWAVALGTSEHTYRERLERGQPEDYWLGFALEIVGRERDRSVNPRAVAAATPAELEGAAYAVAAAAPKVARAPAPAPDVEEVVDLGAGAGEDDD